MCFVDQSLNLSNEVLNVLCDIQGIQCTMESQSYVHILNRCVRRVQCGHQYTLSPLLFCDINGQDVSQEYLIVVLLTPALTRTCNL